MPENNVRASVLVADDDAAVRALLRNMLERAGLTVFPAANGKEAIEMARHSPFDIAIVDMVMPEKDGLETIQELRRIRPLMAVIAISGAFPAKVLQLASRLGADAALAKPVQEDELVSSVFQLLDSRSRDGGK